MLAAASALWPTSLPTCPASLSTSTTAGMRNREKNPITSGARTATAATTSRLPNDTSGMPGHSRKRRLSLLSRRCTKPLGDVVGDAEGVGDDRQGGIHRGAGDEE